MIFKIRIHILPALRIDLQWEILELPDQILAAGKNDQPRQTVRLHPHDLSDLCQPCFPIVIPLRKIEPMIRVNVRSSLHNRIRVVTLLPHCRVSVGDGDPLITWRHLLDPFRLLSVGVTFPVVFLVNHDPPCHRILRAPQTAVRFGIPVINSPDPDPVIRDIPVIIDINIRTKVIKRHARLNVKVSITPELPQHPIQIIEIIHIPFIQKLVFLITAEDKPRAALFPFPPWFDKDTLQILHARSSRIEVHVAAWFVSVQSPGTQ